MRLNRKSLRLSDAMIAAAPIRKTTFESTLNRLSAAIRWTSEMSLLIRETTSPNLLRTQNRGESICKCRYTATRMSNNTSADTRTYW